MLNNNVILLFRRMAAKAPFVFYLFVWLMALIVALPYFFAVSAETVDNLEPWNSAKIDELVWIFLIELYSLLFSAWNLRNVKAKNLSWADLAPSTDVAPNLHSYCSCYPILFAVGRTWVCLLSNWINYSQTSQVQHDSWSSPQAGFGATEPQSSVVASFVGSCLRNCMVSCFWEFGV